MVILTLPDLLVSILLLGGFTICGFTTAGVIEVHFQPYAVSCGFLPTEGATAYGVHGLFNMLGVIMFGFLADRLNRPMLLGAIYLIRATLFVGQILIVLNWARQLL